MRLVLTFLVIVARCLTVSGQHSIDSLETLLKKTPDDSVRIIILNTLNAYYYDTNPDRFAELSQEAVRLVGATTRKESVVVAYLNWASAEEVRGNYDSSILYNQKAFVIYEQMNDSLGMSAALNNLGITYMQLGDYASCVYSLQRALSIDEASTDSVNLCIDYINLADAYLRANYLKDSEYWARKGVHLAEQISKANTPYAAEILGTVLLENGDTDSATYYFRYARALGLSMDHEYIVNRSYLHLGKVHSARKQYDSARWYFAEGVRRSQNKNPSDVLIPSLIELSACYQYNRQYALALNAAREALQHSVRIKNNHLAKESSEALARYFEAMNQRDSSIAYLKKASEFMEATLAKSIRGSIEAKTTDLKLQQEQARRHEAVTNLEQQRKLFAQQRLLLLGAIIIMISLGTILFLINRASRMRAVANAQLTMKNAELNRLNQEINGLINTIVHDLKSPLNTLHGIFKLMEPDMKENPKFSEFILYGNQVIHNAHTIVSELLELREMEENPTKPDFTSFYLSDLAQELSLRFEPMAKEKNLTLLIQLKHSIVFTDRIFLQRILDNLISNAIKFSPSNKKVTVSGVVENGKAEIMVSDQGPGFHEKDIEKIYGKFQKLSARPTGGESSNGLGLAIVKLLVSRLNGEIKLDSAWGHGATFSISIPVTPA